MGAAISLTANTSFIDKFSQLRMVQMGCSRKL